MQTVDNDVRMAVFASKFLDALGDPISSVATEDLAALVSRPMPEPSDDVTSFRDAYWAAEAFSKTPFSIEGVDRKARALEKFIQCEQVCHAANAAWVGWESRPWLHQGIISHARHLLQKVLGVFSWDEALGHMSFGPGASTSLPRRKARHSNKWGLSSHITERCLPLYLAFNRLNNGWSIGDRELRIVAGNKVTTVPKNAKIDRVIAVEPDWNMFFQRGIGGLLRKRAQRIGLLTPTAQERNRFLARAGSVDGSLTTIDLSGASDSVSLALCEALLPGDWFSAMCTTRSPSGVAGDTVIQYEKISSMGNGYTFELETLLFWALTRACCRDGVVVAYGDDIICPSEYTLEVILALEMAGFSVNEKKTWCRSHFRESCGGHYLHGQDVTPPYFRHLDAWGGGLKPLSHRISMANRLSAAAEERFGYWRDGRFRSLHDELCDGVPRYLFGPKDLGDAVLHVPFDQARPERSSRYQCYKLTGIVGYNTASFGDRRVGDKCYDHEDTDGSVFASLWGEPSMESYLGVPMAYRRQHLYTTGWNGPAAWLDADASF